MAAAIGFVSALVGCSGESEILRGRLREAQNEMSELRSANGMLSLKVKDLERRLGETAEKYSQDMDDLRKSLLGQDVDVGSKYGFPMLSLPDRVFFDPGRNDVKTRGQEVLRTVASIIKSKYPTRAILVEGHTDSDPIKHSSFRSNLDLSVSRAASVSLLLAKEGGIEPKLILTAGRGEFDPVAANDTKENKGLNRRVEIVILPGSMAAGAGTPATKGGEPPAPVTPAEPAPGMMKSPAPVTPPEPAPPADEAPKAD